MIPVACMIIMARMNAIAYILVTMNEWRNNMLSCI